MTTQQDASTPSTRLDPAVVKLGLVLVVGIFMSMLDTTIVNVALPTIGHDLDADLATLQWVVTGYMLAIAIMIPMTGWLVDRFGAKNLFVLSTAVFAAASGLCALAWNAEILITLRIAQGVGGALLMPVAQTILARSAGPQRMGRVMAIVGVPALLAPVLGPILGGVIVDNLNWQWIFLINVPVGIASVILSIRALPARSRQVEAPGRFDLAGLALIGPGLALIVYGLSRASADGGFGAIDAWGTLTGGVILVIAYGVYAGLRGGRALVPLAFFRDRAFSASATVSLIIGISVQGVLLLLTLYCQLDRGETALTTGLLLIPQGIGTALSMPIAGMLTDKFGARSIVVTGMALTTLGTLPFALATADSSTWWLAIVLFIRGLGFGATMMPTMAAGYRNLPKASAAHVTSVLQIFSRIGGTLGGAVMIVILTQQLAAGRATSASDQAFATTFWWATAITAAGTLLALLLPGKQADGTRATTT